MIGNYNPEKIKQLILKSIKKTDFIENLIKEHRGNEEIVLSVIQDTFEEILKESNPFRWEPVKPQQFLSDPYFLGFNPETGEGVASTLHEKLKEEFCEIHKENATYSEVVLTGGIGWGKSFFMEICMIWQLYLLSCLKAPQLFFGLGANTKIALMIISITEKQSKKNVFSGIKEALKKIPYFIENFQFDSKRATESLIFPNNIEIMNATSEHSSTIGLNIYSACLDEANFFKKVTNSKRAQEAGEIYDEALVLYQSVRRRLDARFLQNGHKPGIFYIASSKVYPNDFTATLVEKAKEIERENGTKSIYVMDYNLWTVKRDRYSKEEFKVMVGGINSRSRIIDEFDNLPIVGEVIHVPMDFYDAFRKNIDNSIRDIAGVATYTVQPFIGNKEYIGNAFLHGEQLGLKRIFSVDIATLSPKPEFLQTEYIIPHKIRHPEAVRYIGIDIGIKNDKFGFAMGYIDGYTFVKKEYFNAEKQMFDTYEEKLPKLVIEMLLVIKKEEEFGEVELSRVRNLILQLMRFGYKIRQVSMDGFQSTDMFQILKRYGIEGTYISMDKTTEPYETYRSALYEERVYSVYHPILELELNELERNYVSKKIDHNSKGSKDLSDAAGQIVYNMHINPIYNDMPLLPVSIGNNNEDISQSYNDIIEQFEKWARN